MDSPVEDKFRVERWKSSVHSCDGEEPVAATSWLFSAELSTQDGRLHELQLDGTIVSLPANCSTTQQLVGPPAVSGQHAFVGSKSAVLLAANASGYCNRLALPNGASSPPVENASMRARGSRIRQQSDGSGDIGD